jgi:hypothetical protein
LCVFCFLFGQDYQQNGVDEAYWYATWALAALLLILTFASLALIRFRLRRKRKIKLLKAEIIPMLNSGKLFFLIIISSRAIERTRLLFSFI